MLKFIRNHFPVIAKRAILALITFAALLVSFYMYVYYENQIDKANQLRYSSFRLADHLRQSSDDLTRMARTYVVTSDPLYKKYFYEILDIRNGNKPLPKGYFDIYWDLVLADKLSVDFENREKIALLDMMYLLNFTENEFDKMAKAKSHSDALVALEADAMSLVELINVDVEANRAEAIRMLHDKNYHQIKAKIMKPINEFYALVNTRTLDNINQQKKQSAIFRTTLIITALAFLFLLWRFYLTAHRTLGSSVDEIHRLMTKIGRNDFSTEIKITPSTKDSVLAGLSKMQGKLYAHKIERTKAEEELRITEESLRISQQRLRLHREQSPIGVIEWNTDSTFNDWNPAAEKIFGFTKDEVQDEHITDRILPESARPAVNKIWEDLLANRGGAYSLNENITKDGRTILCEWHNTPLVDHDGHVIGVTSIVDDVTEGIAAKNAQLEKEKAEAATQAKSQFLANMSHEIRTPLNTVLGMANIGIRDSTDAKAKEAFNHILDSGQHLLAVINDVLEFSKIEAGKLSTESRPFQLISTVENTINMMTERAQTKGLKLSVNLASNLPGWVLGDSLRLQQILLNLLSNAIKFTSEGEVLVSVSRDGDMTCFRIADTGVGLNEKQISRLFAPFEQADASTTRKFGGTGLSLTISHNLAQLMGGDISVESQVNKGSVFTLNLPLAETKAADIKASAEAEISEPRLKGLRVLAADDVETNRIILDDMLEHEGASTVFVEDGQQAIDRLQQIGVDQIDVILMDIQMPVMDGYEAARRILEMAPNIPIIGVTAHALKAEHDKCLAAGMVAHVTKPCDPDVLVSVILRHV